MLCENIFDADIEDVWGMTPLAAAVVHGRGPSGLPDTEATKVIVRLLAQMGANLCLRDDTGRALMHYACSRWDVEVVSQLLACNETALSRRKRGGAIGGDGAGTTMDVGAGAGASASAGADGDSEAFLANISDVDIGVTMDDLVLEGGNVETLESVVAMRSSVDGWTPLHYVCAGMALKSTFGGVAHGDGGGGGGGDGGADGGSSRGAQARGGRGMADMLMTTPIDTSVVQPYPHAGKSRTLVFASKP
jgi:hypothetical protein